MGIQISAHIWNIGSVIYDDRFNELSPELDCVGADFPVLNKEIAKRMQDEIARVRADGDSVGGDVECAITGLPAGLGQPMFGGVESRIAQIIYGIPAVKGLEFGEMRTTGSTNNDAFTIKDGKITTTTNCCGGILGGITNGMPVIFSVSLKPTPSISCPQQSVSLSRMEQQELIVKGRHDPCIVPRAVPVVEAATAIAIYDLILSNTQTDRRK
jgi:chorismate synthase